MSQSPSPSEPELVAKATKARRPRIELRRFAGHSVYAERFATPVRVMHLTDQHVGRVTPFEIQMEAVAMANAERPDLVALTGDFVCHSLAYLDQLQEVVSAFQAPVVCVLGNHDYWSGADEVTRALERAGACVLKNENTIVELKSARLQIVGIDDAYTGHADVAKAVRGLDRSIPALGLSHIAEEADHLWHHDVPLVLAGHTHAGQVTLARLHEVAFGRITGHRYVHGLYGSRAEQGAVYVGAGIGAAVIPLRLGDRGKREVTLFELGAVPGDRAEHHEEQVALKGRKPSDATKARRHAAVKKKSARRAKRKAPVPPAQ
jgi:predicted MPP superfamily phosphohydrolase